MKRSNVDFSDSKRRNIKMRQEQKSFLAKEHAKASYSNTNTSAPNSSNNNYNYSSYRQMNQNNGQPNVHYIPWDQRSKYTPSMFFGDPSQPWTPQNTSGWNVNDLNNPYNPRRNKYNAPASNQYQSPTPQPRKKHHHHFFAYTCLAILIALVAWIGFGVYSGDNQSTQPQNQKPRTVRKTVIEHQPKNPNSTQNNQAQGQISDLQRQVEKLQADMQNANLSSKSQQKLLNDFQNLDKEDQKKIYELTNVLDHMLPSKKLQRKLFSSVID